MLTGSCLCQQVRYQIDANIDEIVHCHCTTCRKAHGAAFSSVAKVMDKDWQITAGEALLTSFESSAGKFRYFCSCCGSQIYAKRNYSAHLILRMGTLDSDIEVLKQSHIWLEQQASWYEVNHQLPCFAQFD